MIYTNLPLTLNVGCSIRYYAKSKMNIISSFRMFVIPLPTESPKVPRNLGQSHSDDSTGTGKANVPLFGPVTISDFLAVQMS